MKKLFKSIIAGTLAAACCGAVVLAGCGSDDEPDDPVTETNTYTITFDYNYSGSTSTTQTVEEGGTVTKPTDPTRDGYTFDAWYTTSSCTTEVDFTSKIYANATYYAGWTEVAAAVTEYTVTFVITSSASETQTVTVGETVDVPEDPENGSYIFSGWYADEACETSFDFSAEITADTTVYAGWIEVGDDEVAIIYMWNYEGAGVYKVVTQTANKMVTSLASASRVGYYLKGWYTDEECTTQYVTNSGRLNENLTLYALWYQGYTFEAEYTNMYNEDGTPREFCGYSENIKGEGAIAVDTTDTASNGYYVGAMYDSGKYLEFEIVSDAAVTDAVLYLRLAMGYGFGSSITLSSSEYLITVNGGTALSYTTLVLGCPATISEITDFGDYIIGNISLNEGTNVIRLEVDNNTNGEGGSQWAKAPLVDCIKVYSSSTLTWTPITSNIG